MQLDCFLRIWLCFFLFLKDSWTFYLCICLCHQLPRSRCRKFRSPLLALQAGSISIKRRSQMICYYGLVWPVRECHTSGIIWRLFVCVWDMHPCHCISYLLPFIATWYSIVEMGQFVHTSADGFLNSVMAWTVSPTKFMCWITPSTSECEYIWG